MSVLSLSTAHRAGLGRRFSFRSPQISPFLDPEKCEAESSVAAMAWRLLSWDLMTRRRKGKALLSASAKW